MRPSKLDVAGDYQLALLRLMGRLRSARIAEALAAFEEELGQLIPEKHRETNSTGRIKWQHYVMWARFVLARAGLLTSGGRGVWAIAPAGEEWLRQHGDAASSDLAAALRRGDAMGNRSFEWRGKRYEVDKEALFSRVRRLLQAGPPPEALRYKQWAVLIDGQPVSVKWLFALVTGADHNEFDSPTARRLLARAGIDAQNLDESDERTSMTTSPDRERGTLQRDAFLERAAEQLRACLSPEIGYSAIRHYPGRNYLQVFFPGFGSCHYELWLARGFDEVGFHLEGRREENLARLAILAPHTEEMSAALGMPVVAMPWGANWARLGVGLAQAAWTDETAREYASLLARFVGVTLALVREAMSSRVPQSKTRAAPKPPPASVLDSRAHAILDQQLAQIRAFLQGRSSRPSDEVLCEWVQLCYTFELFGEGAELFQMVIPGAVNEWLYGRTSRLAKVCRMRAPNKG